MLGFCFVIGLHAMSVGMPFVLLFLLLFESIIVVGVLQMKKKYNVPPSIGYSRCVSFELKFSQVGLQLNSHFRSCR
jgi:hypothetical protein